MPASPPDSTERTPAAPATDRPAHPPLDWDALVQRFGQRAGFVERLAQAALTSHNHTPQRLRDAAAAADAAAIADLAHALKGTAGNLAAQELREVARATEAKARDGAADAPQAAVALAAAVDALLAALEARLAT